MRRYTVTEDKPLPANAYDKKPLIQKLQQQLKEAEHIVKAVLIRKNYVTPTYLCRLSEEYAEKYNLTL